MSRRRVSCGLEQSHVPDLTSILQISSESCYDFITIPIVNPRYEREFDQEKPASQRPGPLTFSDLMLSSNDWSSLVVGRLGASIDVDSKVEHIRRNSEERLAQELRYASHLGLPAVMVTLQGPHHTNLARIISNTIQKGASFQIWVQVPLTAPDMDKYEERDKDIFETRPESTWDWWNRFRLVAGSHNKINLCLGITETCPSDTEVQRWLGEPVKTVRLATSMFLLNKKGYPVLSKPHQSLIRRFVNLDIQIIIAGAGRGHQMKFYQQYLDHLYQQHPVGDPLQQFARGYEDYLQCPLQPLMDNLESQTYEVFEKDPVKYSEYENAMKAALTDMVPETELETKELVLIVVGAGRGPLVRAALRASEATQRRIRVFAVEKNPNAVITLQHQQLELWGDQVTVISSDMRDWNPPPEDYADILVSELLGSFGDNELSPECLDGAQKFLKPGGISIPYSYTSYIGPMQSSKLYNEVRNCKDETKHPLANFETPYVVHFQNRFELAPPQALFTFEHPNHAKVIDNTRYSELSFNITADSVLHGFGGYFECYLYKDIMISILPSTHSPGMFSWFPILFPLKDPVQLKKEDTLKLHFWRNVTRQHVWYEWAVSDPVSVPVHNPNGRSYEIGL